MAARFSANGKRIGRPPKNPQPEQTPAAQAARELGMNYSAIGVVTNYSTGMTSYVTDDGIGSVMCEMRDSVFDVCFDLIKNKTC